MAPIIRIFNSLELINVSAIKRISKFKETKKTSIHTLLNFTQKMKQLWLCKMYNKIALNKITKQNDLK